MRTTLVYDPPKVGAIEAPQVDPEDVPDEGEAEDTDAQRSENGEGGEAVPPAGSTGLCSRCLVLSENPAQRACGCDVPLRPVRLLHERGATCPICRSRYGRFDVITPVSLATHRR